MSIYSIYTKMIASCNSFITRKEKENKDLAQEEKKQEELLKAQEWQTYYTKKNLRKQKNAIYSFLRENGGVFNLNDEQKAYYGNLLIKCDNLNLDFKNSYKTQYNLIFNVTGLENRQQSNYSSLILANSDKGKYLIQQALFENNTP